MLLWVCCLLVNIWCVCMYVVSIMCEVVVMNMIMWLDLLQLFFQVFDGECVIGWCDGVVFMYIVWCVEVLCW